MSFSSHRVILAYSGFEPQGLPCWLPGSFLFFKLLSDCPALSHHGDDVSLFCRAHEAWSCSASLRRCWALQVVQCVSMSCTGMAFRSNCFFVRVRHRVSMWQVAKLDGGRHSQADLLRASRCGVPGRPLLSVAQHCCIHQPEGTTMQECV